MQPLTAICHATGPETAVDPQDLAAILDGQEIDAVYFDGFATAAHGENSVLPPLISHFCHSVL